MHRSVLLAAGLAALAELARAEPPDPANPPAPWFVISDIPSSDPAVADTRWLWNRTAQTLRYCRQSASTQDFSCAPDVVLPEGHWVIDRVQNAPEPGTASSARFYSPDEDRTLTCRASDAGDFSCE